MPSVHGVNDDGAGFGVKGENTMPASLGHLHEAGVVGTSQGGVGVLGTSGDISSFHPFGSAVIGVQGVSPDGTGVSAISGTGHGVSASSDSGDGVLGVGKNGVHGRSSSPTDSGVLGENSGNGAGVQGNSQSGTGVVANSVSGVGVFAVSQTGSAAVQGLSFTGTGVQGNSGHVLGSPPPTGDGVFGQGKNGVHGVSLSATDSGVLGENGTAGGRGVFGNSTGTSGIGVLGQADTTNGRGVVGISNSGIGVHGQGGFLAGNFEGDVRVHGKIFGEGDISCETNIFCKGDMILSGDCAERFATVGGEQLEPGTVVVIEDSGLLRPSERPYDKKVAGVVSRAGGYRAMQAAGEDRPPGGAVPIALAGTVNCKVDARVASVEVGDLLTTSTTPGHAMKAEDPIKAFGAVIGKALYPLGSGQGVIRILVAMQ